MTECRDCGTEIKHVGDGVWIDRTQGDCCWETDETHQPVEPVTNWDRPEPPWKDG